MDWYRCIALVAIIAQMVFLIQMYNNHRYALAKYKRKRSYRPNAVLIVPCKGMDSAFDEKITSFFNQDYENYSLWFVVADTSDPACDQLSKLKNRLGQTSKSRDIQIMVAGHGKSCSQKIHNLLYCCRRIDSNIEVLAFADSDACIRSDWLSHLVYPLRKSKNGAASGYRWFIPKKNNFATLALSAVNAKVAQLLGNTFFNLAWGGSMAIRVDVFRRIGLDKIWQTALSDDLSLSYAVKKAGLKVAFVPACLVASYESTTWKGLFEFGRRQFLITRISAPGMWWFGLCSTLFSILGLWGGAALALYAAKIGEKNLLLFAAVPVLFFTSQFIRAVMRQKMADKLLKYEHRASNTGRRAMRAASVADLLLFWLWSFLLLLLIISSALGRTICWRGIRYKLLSPTQTIVLTKNP